MYRRRALQRFSSPERTDRLQQITGSWTWLALVALAVAVGAALIWSIWGTVPINVTGSGIIQLHMGGTRAVVAQESGMLTEVLVSPGSLVKEGDVIAHVEMYGTLPQLQGARLTLVNVQKERRQLEEFYARYSADQGSLFRRQRQQYTALLKDLDERIKSQQQMLDGVLELRKTGYVSAVDVNSTRDKLMNIVNQRDQAHVSLLQVDTQEQSMVNQREHDLQANTEKLIAAQNQLENLEEQIRLGSDVRAPVSGKVVEFGSQLHTIVEAGKTVALIEFGSRRSVAIIYVPTDQGKRIVEGMRANVSPTTVRPEQYGNIRGTVKSVGAYPATPTDMMSTLNNSTLISTFSATGPPLEVQIALDEDPHTVSGFAWTSEGGPPSIITSGTLATANIAVESDPPITLVVPFFKKFFGL